MGCAVKAWRSTSASTAAPPSNASARTATPWWCSTASAAVDERVDGLPRQAFRLRGAGGPGVRPGSPAAAGGRVLEVLLSASGRVVSSEELLGRVSRPRAPWPSPAPRRAEGACDTFDALLDRRGRPRAAWEDVWICVDPWGHIQAVGTGSCSHGVIGAGSTSAPGTSTPAFKEVVEQLGAGATVLAGRRRQRGLGTGRSGRGRPRPHRGRGGQQPSSRLNTRS